MHRNINFYFNKFIKNIIKTFSKKSNKFKKNYNTAVNSFKTIQKNNLSNPKQEIQNISDENINAITSDNVININTTMLLEESEKETKTDILKNNTLENSETECIKMPVVETNNVTENIKIKEELVKQNDNIEILEKENKPERKKTRKNLEISNIRPKYDYFCNEIKIDGEVKHEKFGDGKIIDIKNGRIQIEFRYVIKTVLINDLKKEIL